MGGVPDEGGNQADLMREAIKGNRGDNAYLTIDAIRSNQSPSRGQSRGNQEAINMQSRGNQAAIKRQMLIVSVHKGFSRAVGAQPKVGALETL
jgi:hypothetical protein